MLLRRNSPDSLHAFKHGGHGTNLRRSGVLKPQAPAHVAVDEFFRPGEAPEKLLRARLPFQKLRLLLLGENEIAVVRRLVAAAHLRPAAQGFLALGHEQIDAGSGSQSRLDAAQRFWVFEVRDQHFCTRAHCFDL